MERSSSPAMLKRNATCSLTRRRRYRPCSSWSQAKPATSTS